MTLILGIESPDDNTAIVCADSGAWRSEIRFENRRPKVFRRGALVIAMCGDVWHGQLARTVAWEDPDVSDVAVIEYIDRVLTLIAEQADRIQKTQDEKMHGPSIVVAAGARVYHSGPDGGVASPTHGIVSAGYGYQVAYGAALALREQGVPTMANAERTMRLATQWTDGCMAPIRWMTTTGEEGVWE